MVSCVAPVACGETRTGHKMRNRLPIVFENQQSLQLRCGLIWLALVIVLSVAASILPARNATKLTIREVLAYE